MPKHVHPKKMINRLVRGDSAKVLKRVPKDSVDLIVTDPPYAISFMAKTWDRALPPLKIWQHCLRVLKPGAFMFVNCIPRQDCQSRMVALLEEAGFWVNFTPLYWAFASGFPKAVHLERLNKSLQGGYGGWQPKPAVEPILVVMKPCSEKTWLSQALSNRKGCVWFDDARIPTDLDNEPDTGSAYYAKRGEKYPTEHSDGSGGSGANFKYKPHDRSLQDKGRFPANLLVSGNAIEENFNRYFSLDAWWSKRVRHLPPKAQKTFPFMLVPKAGTSEKNKGLIEIKGQMDTGRKKGFSNPFNRGGEQRRNIHPTVKPLDLISYLVTIGSRKDDLVMDPFLGSGTTAIAAKLLGRKYFGIEREQEYFEISEDRLRGNTWSGRLLLEDSKKCEKKRKRKRKKR